MKKQLLESPLIRLVSSSFNGKTFQKIFIGDNDFNKRFKPEQLLAAYNSPKKLVTLNQATKPDNDKGYTPQQATAIQYDGSSTIFFMVGKDFQDVNGLDSVDELYKAEINRDLLQNYISVIEYEKITEPDFLAMISTTAKAEDYGLGDLDSMFEEEDFE